MDFKITVSRNQRKNNERSKVENKGTQKENNFFLKVDNSGSEKEFKLITEQELKSLKDKIKQEEKADKYLSIYIYPLDNNILFINAPIFAPPFMILNYLEIPYYEIRPRRN